MSHYNTKPVLWLILLFICFVTFALADEKTPEEVSKQVNNEVKEPPKEVEAKKESSENSGTTKDTKAGKERASLVRLDGKLTTRARRAIDEKRRAGEIGGESLLDQKPSKLHKKLSTDVKERMLRTDKLRQRMACRNAVQLRNTSRWFTADTEKKVGWCISACPKYVEETLKEKYNVQMEKIVPVLKPSESNQFFTKYIDTAKPSEIPDIVVGRITPQLRHKLAISRKYLESQGTFLFPGLAGLAVFEDTAMFVKVLQRWYWRQGCDLTKTNLMPLQWAIHTRGQCKIAEKKLRLFAKQGNTTDSNPLVAAQAPHKYKLWVGKYSAKYNKDGSGLQFYNSTETLLKDVDCTGDNYRMVIQQYIKPMLAGGAVFDARSFVLIASTKPWVVFTRPGYFRRSQVPYDFKSVLAGTADKAMHMTSNTFGTSDSTVWSPDKMAQTLEEEGKMSKEKFWKGYQAAIRDGALKSVLAALGTIMPRNGTYQQLYIDHLVDEDGNWILLEMHVRNTVHKEMKARSDSATTTVSERDWRIQQSKAQVDDMLDIVVQVQSGRLPIHELPFGWMFGEKNEKYYNYELLWTSRWSNKYFDPVNGTVPCHKCGNGTTSTQLANGLKCSNDTTVYAAKLCADPLQPHKAREKQQEEIREAQEMDRQMYHRLHDKDLERIKKLRDTRQTDVLRAPKKRESLTHKLEGVGKKHKDLTDKNTDEPVKRVLTHQKKEKDTAKHRIEEYEALRKKVSAQHKPGLGPLERIEKHAEKEKKDLEVNK